MEHLQQIKHRINNQLQTSTDSKQHPCNQITNCTTHVLMSSPKKKKKQAHVLIGLCLGNGLFLCGNFWL